MNLIKSVVLGSAAALVAVGAQAADLPVKAKAVDYVRICSLYGAGFWYIPGTDTCIKLGGFVRADLTINGGAHGAPAWNGDLGEGDRFRDYYAARSRFVLTTDTRTATEYGVVRTFAQADFQFQNFGNTNPAVLGAAPTNPLAGVNPALLMGVGGGYTSVEFIFIQFGGFTFGKSGSAYATPWHSALGEITAYLLGGHDTVTGTNNVQYTAEFGNGVSASVGLDDPTVYDRTPVYNLSTGIGGLGTGAVAYGGFHAPDIVGRVRVDQNWGLFQVSGAAHDVNATYNILNTSAAAGAIGAPTALSVLSGHPSDKWGGAVMAALQLKNLPTGPGDDIKIDASYAVGDTKNVISTTSTSPSFAMFGGTGVAGAYQSVALGATTDAVYLPAAFGGDGNLKLTKSWGMRGMFNHNWNEYWSSGVYGTYSSVIYDGTVGDLSTAMGAYCSAFAASHPGMGVTYTCNPNFNVSQLGVITRWTPINSLAFSAEVQWVHLDQKMGNGPGLGTSTSNFSPGAPLPAATYEFKNQNTVLLQLRVQKNF